MWFYFCVPGENLFQVRGQNGFIFNSMDPLPRVFGKEQVSDTANHALETFYPVSPTVDLQEVYVYKEEVNCTGEQWLCLLRLGNNLHTLFVHIICS